MVFSLTLVALSYFFNGLSENLFIQKPFDVLRNTLGTVGEHQNFLVS